MTYSSILSVQTSTPKRTLWKKVTSPAPIAVLILLLSAATLFVPLFGVAALGFGLWNGLFREVRWSSTFIICASIVGWFAGLYSVFVFFSHLYYGG